MFQILRKGEGGEGGEGRVVGGAELQCPGQVEAMSLTSGAPHRLRTELPQTLRLQHPQQLQWGPQATPIVHVSGQWPFGAPRHL